MYNRKTSDAGRRLLASSLSRLYRICTCTLVLGSVTCCEFKNLDYLSAGGASSSPVDSSTSPDSGGRVCMVGDTAPPPPCGHATLIDDMEDGNGSICETSGRSGPWEAYSDGTGTQSPASGAIRAMQDLPECRGFSSRALHVQGLRFTSWGMGVDLNLANHVRYDVSGQVGLRFWAKSNTDTLASVRVEVATAETLDASFGGTCVPTAQACNDHFGTNLVISGAWVLYDVTFADLTQEGWGVSGTWNAQNAIQVHWIFKDSDFDVWIDDVEFR